MTRWQAKVLLEGTAQAKVLRLDAPISFWGGIDPATSQVILAGHPQFGERVSGKILVIRQLIGSSSSSAVMLELAYGGLAPAALILGARDAILPIGVVVAGQMGWKTLPVLVLPDPPFQTEDVLSVDDLGMIKLLPSPDD